MSVHCRHHPVCRSVEEHERNSAPRCPECGSPRIACCCPSSVPASTEEQRPAAPPDNFDAQEAEDAFQDYLHASRAAVPEGAASEPPALRDEDDFSRLRSEVESLTKRNAELNASVNHLAGANRAFREGAENKRLTRIATARRNIAEGWRKRALVAESRIEAFRSVVEQVRVGHFCTADQFDGRCHVCAALSTLTPTPVQHQEK